MHFVCGTANPFEYSNSYELVVVLNDQYLTLGRGHHLFARCEQGARQCGLMQTTNMNSQFGRFIITLFSFKKVQWRNWLNLFFFFFGECQLMNNFWFDVVVGVPFYAIYIISRAREVNV